MKNWDVDLQVDRTCEHPGCQAFGSHKVITLPDADADRLTEWMCSGHSLGAVMDSRLSLGPTVRRFEVA